MGDEEMKLAKKAFSGWFTSKTTKMTRAAQHYERAANKYKTAKQYVKAADAFQKYAETHLELGSSLNNVTKGFRNAGVQLKLAKDPRCIDMYDKAATVLCDQGKHSQAAKMLQEMADLAVKDKEYEEAVMHYKKAAGLYESDDYPVQANRCREKVATFEVEKTPPNFSEAAEIFEDIGRKGLESRLGRHGARKFFFKAAICILAAGDAVLAREKVDTYARLDPSLARGREGKLLKQLVEATENYDVKALATHLQAYNEITEFDQWHIKVLTAVRKHIDPDMDSVDEVAASDKTEEASTVATAPPLPNVNSSSSDSLKDKSANLGSESTSKNVVQLETANTIQSDDEDNGEDFFG